MAEGTFSIRLISPSGDPLKNREITVFMGWSHEKNHTDGDGWADFGLFGNNHTEKIYSYVYRGLGKAHSVVLTTGEQIYDGATFSFVIEDD